MLSKIYLTQLLFSEKRILLTLQATSNVSLTGRFEPFCTLDMATSFKAKPQSGDPVLPVIFLLSMKAYIGRHVTSYKLSADCWLLKDLHSQNTFASYTDVITKPSRANRLLAGRKFHQCATSYEVLQESTITTPFLNDFKINGSATLLFYPSSLFYGSGECVPSLYHPSLEGRARQSFLIMVAAGNCSSRNPLQERVTMPRRWRLRLWRNSEKGVFINKA